MAQRNADFVSDDDIGKKLRPVLRQLNSLSTDIEASAVMTTDGLPLASVLDEEVDPDRFGAMCASLLALAETTAREVDRGELRQVLIEGTKGSMLVVHIGSKAVLAVAATPTVNLGMVFLEAKKAAREIANIV